jgi:hypothetical protein
LPFHPIPQFLRRSGKERDMTSHYRHRRLANPATTFPTPIEPGEIAVNSANRQLAIGDADPASSGVVKLLLAVRIFDTKAQYAVGDFVVQAGGFYRARVAISPGAFNAANWDTFAFAGLMVAKAGDTMTGPLVLSGAPTLDLHAATKLYADTVAAQGGTTPLPASAIVNTPAGAISATTVQAAINELDNEKAPVNAPMFTGDARLQTSPLPGDSDTSIATTAFVADAVGTAVGAIDLSPYAPKDSPTFTGDPQAPTRLPGDNDTSVATTAFVTAAVAAAAVPAASALEYVSNSQPDKMLTPRAVWGSVAPITLTDAASVAPDLSKGSDFIWTPLASGRNLANPVGGKPGQKGVIYFVPGTGSVTTYGPAYKFPNGTKPVHAGLMIWSYIIASDGVTAYCNSGVSYG